MAEDWAAIAAQVSGAIAEVGQTVTITKRGPGPQNPYSTEMQMTTDTEALAVDMGIRQNRAGGEYASRRVLLMAAGSEAPVMGDAVTVRGIKHQVAAVQPTAPGGVDVMIKVELQA